MSLLLRAYYDTLQAMQVMFFENCELRNFPVRSRHGIELVQFVTLIQSSMYIGTYIHTYIHTYIYLDLDAKMKSYIHTYMNFVYR